MAPGSERRAAALGLAAALLAAAGCGPATTVAAGKVTFQGKAVAWGTVTLAGPDGTVRQGLISPDGGFSIPDVRAGTVRVGVVSGNPEAKRGADAGDRRGPPPPKLPPGAWFPLPERFADFNTSGVTAEVKAGQPLEIDLK
ncbi:MAG: hypothetical protein C0501_06315 [Isosphaera sp.]|nr:hypothetical protein [Isosphaera sp.]